MLYPAEVTNKKIEDNMQKRSNWRPFAEHLTTLSKSEGLDHFFDHAFAFLNDYVTVDSCAVFKVAVDKKSGAEHLGTFGRLPTELAKLLAQDYAKNGFKNDPMVQTALLSPRVKVRRLSGSHYSPSYKSQYFEKANLIDKITSIHSSRNVLFLVNFYRVKQQGVFTQEDFKDLERLAPVIGRFVLRHVRLIQTTDKLANNYASKITQLIHDSTQIFSRLSKREREICRLMLLGHEEKEIANDLDVKANTVTTYRRRLYAKLNISSKSDLFKLAFMAQEE